MLNLTFPHVDIFVPSVEELCYMLDRRKFDEWQEKAAGRGLTIYVIYKSLRKESKMVQTKKQPSTI